VADSLAVATVAVANNFYTPIPYGKGRVRNIARPLSFLNFSFSIRQLFRYLTTF
jgi:hypothetical protein